MYTAKSSIKTVLDYCSEPGLTEDNTTFTYSYHYLEQVDALCYDPFPDSSLWPLLGSFLSYKNKDENDKTCQKKKID